MDDLLNIVRESLQVVAPPHDSGGAANPNALGHIGVTSEDYRKGWDEDDGEGAEDIYDDMGAGAGIEGDLEMDEPDD